MFGIEGKDSSAQWRLPIYFQSLFIVLNALVCMKAVRARKGIFFGCLLVFAGVAGCLFTVHLDLNFTIRTLRHSAPIQQETCSRHSLFCSFIIVRWRQVSHVILEQRKNISSGCFVRRVRDKDRFQVLFGSWRLHYYNSRVKGLNIYIYINNKYWFVSGMSIT